MNAVTKDEQASLVGKGSFWFPNKAPGTLAYLHGVAGLDEIRADSSLPNPFNMHLRPGGLALSVMHKFKRYYLAVPFGQLLGVSLETPEAIITKQRQSIIGRAILSGVALGPVGTMVGVLAGLADTHAVVRPDSLLTIEVAEGGQSGYIVAGISDGIFVGELRKWLLKNLTSYYKG